VTRGTAAFDSVLRWFSAAVLGILSAMVTFDIAVVEASDGRGTMST
jgi:hypothetical protein